MKKKANELAEQLQFPCPYCGKTIRLSEVLSHGMKEGLEKELEGRVKVREDELAKEARERAEKLVSMEMKALREDLAEKAKMLEEAEKTELCLRKERRAIESERRRLDLDVIKKVEGARKSIEEETAKRIQEEHDLRDAEKDKLLTEMRKQLSELKRKSEQGSIQVQGETLEARLEEILRNAFPGDEISPVVQGQKGCDVIQKVKTPSGQLCGVVVWEAKRTKNWKDEWIRKLKDDQLKVKADVAAMVTQSLPKEVERAFGFVDGVWVLEPGVVVGVATALRMGLIQAAVNKRALAGEAGKMSALSEYLCGPVFRGRVEALLESFVSLKEETDSERRAMERIWGRRVKTLERAIGNSAGFVGDLEGVLGRGLPGIKGLELKALAAGGEEVSEEK